VIESLIIAAAIASAIIYLVVRAIRKSRQRAKQSPCAGCSCGQKPPFFRNPQD